MIVILAYRFKIMVMAAVEIPYAFPIRLRKKNIPGSKIRSKNRGTADESVMS